MDQKERANRLFKGYIVFSRAEGGSRFLSTYNKRQNEIVTSVFFELGPVEAMLSVRDVSVGRREVGVGDEGGRSDRSENVGVTRERREIWADTASQGCVTKMDRVKQEENIE